MMKGDSHSNTFIVHNDSSGSYTNIEAYIKNLAMEPNVLVIGFLDKCRKEIDPKGDYESEPNKGQFFLGFACKQGGIALSTPDGEMSRYTNALIDKLDSR